MENQFLIDSEYLSAEALEKKHRLETDPSSRKSHMEYMPGMEQITSDVMEKVMSQMNSYDYEKYTAKDVKAALEHETCSIEDFKALLSPAAAPFLEQMAQKAEPFQSFIDPDAPEFVPAGNVPERIREFCRRTGQKVPETIGEIMCCINQSLALKYRYALEQIESCTDKHYSVINMIGGGIQSKLLCQMTAGASGRKVIAGPVEATALGNIAVQLMSLGEIKDVAEARQIIANSETTYEYLPQDAEKWDAAYEKFKTFIQ